MDVEALAAELALAPALVEPLRDMIRRLHKGVPEESTERGVRDL